MRSFCLPVALMILLSSLLLLLLVVVVAVVVVVIMITHFRETPYQIILFYDNSHQLELRVCLSQTL